MVGDGTENHIVMWDLRKHGVTGSKVEKVLDKMNVSVNKNSLPGDANPVAAAGIRLGTPAMTTRGMTSEDMNKIADYLIKAVKISQKIQEKSGKKLKDFV